MKWCGSANVINGNTVRPPKMGQLIEHCWTTKRAQLAKCAAPGRRTGLVFSRPIAVKVGGVGLAEVRNSDPGNAGVG